MANLQVLRKRLKNINSTWELALAMKTVSSVKFTKLNRINSAYSEYAEECRKALALFGKDGFKRSEDVKVKSRNCFIVLSNNRGFCGGFNAELQKFFLSEYEKEAEQPLVYAMGKRIQKYCREKGIEAESRDLPDIPTIEDAKAICRTAEIIFVSGEADNIYVIAQNHENMMTQKPRKVRILPFDSDAVQSNILFLPDRESLGRNLAYDCLASAVYGLMLSNATGAQAATMVAMKSACDNAEESSMNLETTINRIRQAQVTNSVIETSSGMAAGNLEL